MQPYNQVFTLINCARHPSRNIPNDMVLQMLKQDTENVNKISNYTSQEQQQTTITTVTRQG